MKRGKSPSFLGHSTKLTLFGKDGDYEAFLRVLAAAVSRVEMRLLAYCVLPNHWHPAVGAVENMINQPAAGCTQRSAHGPKLARASPPVQ